VHRTLPRVALKFFHFRLDPVNGKVFGSFERAVLKFEQFLKEKTLQLPRLRWQSSLVHSDVVASSWMSLLAIPLNISPLTKRYAQNFELAHASSSPLVPLECSWETFIYLALAMGVSPYSNDWQSLMDLASPHDTALSRLKLSSEQFAQPYEEAITLLEITFNEGCPVATLLNPVITIDIRQMFGWSLVMVLNKSGKCYTVPLLAQDNLTVDKLPPLAILKSLSWDLTDDDLIRLALTWTWYCEDYFDSKSNAERIPTPQIILKARQLATEQLQNLPHGKGALNSLLQTSSADVRLSIETAIQSGYGSINPRSWEAFTALQSMKDLRASLRPEAFLDKNHPVVTLSSLEEEHAILARIIVAFSAACATKQYRWDEEGRRWEEGKWRTTMNGMTARKIPQLPPEPMSLLLGADDANSLRPSKIYLS
jgi:hypothetical protein